MTQSNEVTQEADVRAGSPESFKLGMRNFAGGVALITTVSEGRRYGLLATSVTAVSAEPPALLICTNKDASAHDPIVASGRFCVNVLSRSDMDVADQFATSARRAERFQSGNWTETPSGLPALPSALSWFDCSVDRLVDYNSHTVFFARVLNVSLGPDAMPLVHFNRTYAHSLSAEAPQA